MAQVDRARPGVGIEIERCVLGEAEFDAAGAGVDHPPTCGFAFSMDAAAAGLGLQRAMHIAQVESAGAGVGAHRSRSGLLQGEVAAAGFAIETSGDSGGVNRAASGAYPDAAAGAV